MSRLIEVEQVSFHLLLGSIDVDFLPQLETRSKRENLLSNICYHKKSLRVVPT